MSWTLFSILSRLADSVGGLGIAASEPIKSRKWHTLCGDGVEGASAARMYDPYLHKTRYYPVIAWL
jgi:hypothetical protein